MKHGQLNYFTKSPTLIFSIKATTEISNSSVKSAMPGNMLLVISPRFTIRRSIGKRFRLPWIATETGFTPAVLVLLVAQPAWRYKKVSIRALLVVIHGELMKPVSVTFAGMAYKNSPLGGAILYVW
jgi:hypothetical protein